MRRMQRSFTVSYEWWNEDNWDDCDEIRPQDVDDLETEARRAIAAGLDDSLTGGTLCLVVEWLGRDVEYGGTWSITSVGGNNLPEAPDV